MRKAATMILAVGSVLLLSACATRPAGPMVRVLPAPYKPFEVFQRDHYECEQWADDQIAGRAEAANNRAVGAAVLGTALGAALGAAAGGGEGAGVGAAAGAVVGTAVGADQSEGAGYSLQRRYDIAYAQCMYARGNQVPGYGRINGGVPPPPPPGRAAPPPPPAPRSLPPPAPRGGERGSLESSPSG
jgi:hypothetical protein